MNVLTWQAQHGFKSVREARIDLAQHDATAAHPVNAIAVNGRRGVRWHNIGIDPRTAGPENQIRSRWGHYSYQPSQRTINNYAQAIRRKRVAIGTV